MDVRREIVFSAEPAEVWEALTEPERLEDWFATEVELEPRPGGRGVFRWGNGEERSASVEEVDLLDARASLLAVPPTEDAAAARPRLELDLGGEPVLEPLGLGQRLPDLGGLGRKDDLAPDVHRTPPSCATIWLRVE